MQILFSDCCRVNTTIYFIFFNFDYFSLFNVTHGAMPLGTRKHTIKRAVVKINK